MNAITTEFDAPAVERLIPMASGSRNILAIDIGTTCGWALRDSNDKRRGGSISFSARKTDGAGQRWLKFTAHLSALKREVGDLHAIYYEHVMAHGTKDRPNTIAAHVYGGFLAQLEIFCDVNRIRLEPVGVGEVKKHWTGKGNAKKDAMVAEAKRRGLRVEDDNHADALAILDLAIARESA
ncbi:polynucleotidyl transferase [Caballeronia sp. LZ033]|uniref:polynucleotidyl transferase n=1 Tax=Caballeronia sp. LZ033 TaxID=3038566 RepID=UPI0028551767|nr:polynucleotidyl transferase [Caballeronia sp. LZ033]MDR5813339.1 polynucleotidyl transferase [Caballeronia sp. LZ033]